MTRNERTTIVLGILGGSWVVISRVLSPLIWVITTVTLLITPLITTHEPPTGASRKRAFSPNPPPQRAQLERHPYK